MEDCSSQSVKKAESCTYTPSVYLISTNSHKTRKHIVALGTEIAAVNYASERDFYGSPSFYGVDSAAL